jgi:hypothetical protein
MTRMQTDRTGTSRFAKGDLTDSESEPLPSA